jgi:diaminopimelate decarboxylase
MATSAPSPDAASDPTVQELVSLRPGLRYDARDGLLLDDVPLAGIAAAAGTPTWVYAAATLHRRYATLADATRGMGIHYAVKANDSLAVLRLFAGSGAGADIVSGGELRKVLHAGFAADRIVYSGVGKSAPELRLALQTGIGQINVESEAELALLSELACQSGHTARVALRVNPDVDALTHHKISTGRSADKFGIAWDDVGRLYARAAALPGVRPIGVAMHIGSQITGLLPYRLAFQRMADLVRSLRAQGLAVEAVDCGGGLGVPYRNEPVPSPAALAAAMRQVFHALDVRLTIEPGRWLVAPAGLLLASVVLRKETPVEPVVVLDAAMNDLVRPAMYDAWHGIVPVSPVDAVAPMETVTIAGPVCETGDTFARSRRLPVLSPDAIVAILDAGAYGAVMSSTYNARPLAAQVWVADGRWSVIRPRQAVEDLWAMERLPG